MRHYACENICVADVKIVFESEKQFFETKTKILESKQFFLPCLGIYITSYFLRETSEPSQVIKLL